LLIAKGVREDVVIASVDAMVNGITGTLLGGNKGWPWKRLNHPWIIFYRDSMRLLLRLRALKDQAHDLKYHHKLQGFIYGLWTRKSRVYL
jgi:hypothetical protein